MKTDKTEKLREKIIIRGGLYPDPDHLNKIETLFSEENEEDRDKSHVIKMDTLEQSKPKFLSKKLQAIMKKESNTRKLCQTSAADLFYKERAPAAKLKDLKLSSEVKIMEESIIPDLTI